MRACRRAWIPRTGPVEKAQAGGAGLSALSPFPLTFWKPKQGRTDFRSQQVLWYVLLTVSRQQGPCLFKRCLHFWLRMSDVCGRQTGAWDPEPPNYLSSTHGSQVTRVEASCRSELGRCWLSRFPTLLKPEKKYPHVFFFIA